MANKIFIANVPWTINRKELRDYFSKFGKVIYSQVIFNRTTGLSKNMGFIKYSDNRAYDDVFKREHILENHKMNLFPANEDNNRNKVIPQNNQISRQRNYLEIDIGKIMQ